MGSAKRQRKKFSKPSHPWQKDRILEEKEIREQYGLRRKYEIWKMDSILKNFTRQAKNLVTIRNKQVEKERGQLLSKLHSLGLIDKNAKIEDILSLTLNDIMERRLQTLVYRKTLARTMSQARQFIVHEHIALGDKVVTSPSYLVLSAEEGAIQFTGNSSLADSSHPERAVKEQKKEDGKKRAPKKEKEEKPAEAKEKEEHSSQPKEKEEAPKVKSKKHSGNEESKGSKEEAKEAEA